MSTATDLEARLAQFVEAHVLRGETLDVHVLCDGRPDLVGPLDQLIREYRALTTELDADGVDTLNEPLVADSAGPAAAGLPQFPGFQTIERIGGGGMGEVFKLRDVQLNRIVAAKVMRRDPAVATGLAEFLREARALALFSDRRIVQIFEARVDANPPVLIMEYVEGFELGRIGPSLEFAQRARIVLEVCHALAHAHGLGLQHRDLKPSNIMVDAQLAPRILDFGLSGGDPARGHLKGTLQYVAPEQLDRSQPIDRRTDVYALGVTLYELLCGHPPYAGTTDETVQAIRAGRPQLPVEITPGVPEPLQAIALKAMERDPALRYGSAPEMAADLQRFLDGRTVLARPSIYATTLGDRTAAHLEHVREWLRLRLIHPHEAETLRAAYRALDSQDDDWILASRALTYSQIALYFGAFLLIAGSAFYFVAERWFGAVQGMLRPLVVLGLPFAGLNIAAHRLYRRDHKAVAVAFYLAAVSLLPLLLLILFDESGLFVVPRGTPGQFFVDGSVSNRQLQITTAVAALWCGWLARETRTAALSTVLTVLTGFFGLSVLTDAGLREWLEDGRWDLLALYAVPLVAVYGSLGAFAERTARPWLAKPSYTAAAAVLIAILELLALNGRMFDYLGITLAGLQTRPVSDARLLDTLAAMTLNGVAFYVIAAGVNRLGSPLQAAASQLLFTLAPFAILQPLGYLVRTGEYAPRYDWIYLILAGTIALLSQRRQRRAFYYAGVLNTGSALYLIADHRDWFDKPLWAMLVIAAGLITLGAGFVLDRRQRMRR